MVFFIMPLLGQEVLINIHSPFKSKHLTCHAVNSACKHFFCIEYLSHPIFETQQDSEEVSSRVAIAKKKGLITIEKIWMGTYFKKEIQEGIHPSISIRFISDKMGFGVFANETILASAFVGEYTGVIQKRKPKQLKDKKYVLRYTTWDGTTKFSMEAEEKGNFTRFINHSDKPNLELQSVYLNGMARMVFIAIKEIQKEEQLTFDYGPLYWNKT